MQNVNLSELLPGQEWGARLRAHPPHKSPRHQTMASGWIVSSQDNTAVISKALRGGLDVVRNRCKMVNPDLE